MVKFPIDQSGQQICTSCSKPARYVGQVKKSFHIHQVTGLCSHCIQALIEGQNIELVLENQVHNIKLHNGVIYAKQ